jgi:hypothetical protein
MLKKASKQQQHTINLLMLQTISTYLNIYVGAGEDLQNLRVYTEDVAHNINALNAFNATLDADTLQSAIMGQDTLVREVFGKVLRFLEDNSLVAYSVL